MTKKGEDLNHPFLTLTLAASDVTIGVLDLAGVEGTDLLERISRNYERQSAQIVDRLQTKLVDRAIVKVVARKLGGNYVQEAYVSFAKPGPYVILVADGDRGHLSEERQRQIFDGILGSLKRD